MGRNLPSRDFNSTSLRRSHETPYAAVIALRKRHIALEALPDAIAIPALEARRRMATQGDPDATVDDVAFAMIKVEAEFNAVGDRLHALRKPTVAPGKPALGADGAVEEIPMREGADGAAHRHRG